MMTIRLAEKKDVEGICGLYNRFFTYNAGQQPQYYQPAIETGIYPKSVMESETEDLMIAVDGGEVVGLLHIMEESAPPYDCMVPHRYATVMDLFVRDDYRGKGVGGLLMDSAREWAKKRKLDYLELNVLTENRNARGFYEHERFQAVSQIMRLAL